MRGLYASTGEEQTPPLAAVLDAASARYLVTSRAPKENPASSMGESGYMVRRPAIATCRSPVSVAL